MAFSESFGLGNSTFMDLESEVNKALEVKPKNAKDPERIPKRNGNPLDIIDESPTNSKGSSKHSRSRHHVSQFGAQRRKKFQKSKSDSRLGEKSSVYVHECESKTKQFSKDDNYSEFFKSEFSIEDRHFTMSKESAYVNTSQIEAAINNKTRANEPDEIHVGQVNFGDSKMFSEMIGDLKSQGNDQWEDSSQAFDVPIFSQDVDELLNESNLVNDQSLKVPKMTESDWKESFKINEFPKDQIYDGTNTNESGQLMKVDEEIFCVDDATFICPDEEGKNLAEKTLHDMKMEIHSILHEDGSRDTEGNINSLNQSKAEKSYVKRKSSLHTDALSESLLRDNAKVVPDKSSEYSPKNYKIKRDLGDLKNISAWHLPTSVVKEYEKKGIKQMFEWQLECLSNPKVLFEHSNLVYSAPTSAGKTLVSEILLIKTILERGKKVIVILPFISVVREKMFYLQDLLTPSGYRVEGFFGGYTPPGGFDSINVAICTIEKANSIVNKLMEHGKLDEIGVFVVDEIHLISDPGRGYILELLLAKVLYMSRKFALQIQIITMSATLANTELLKKWLDAEFYVTNYRPVALQEMIKIGTKIYDNNLEFLREITNNEFGGISDQDHVAQLCIETIAEGFSVVVFCPSKDWCENLSVQLAGAINAIGRSGSEIGNKLRANIKRDAVEEVKRQLKDIPTGLDSVLEKTINYACAFHHAGLTTEERDVVEASFKSGALKIIVATSTLSSGVNLPARRVIIRSPLFGGKQMSSLTYKQMIGRAGRTGKDTLGESILICTDSNARIGKELINAALNPICSCLEMESSTHLKRALLEVISSGVASTKADIDSFFKCTLLNTQKELNETEPETEGKSFISDSIDFLIEYEFVRLQHDEESDQDNFVATRLGMACLASSMPPTDGLILFSELQKSRRCFVLESELHAVYLVTPYSVCYQMQDLDWLLYLDLWEKLSPAMKKVGELVGVKESFLVRAMRGNVKLDYRLMQIHKRFYTALALQELVNETPINTVAVKFKCTRGMLQSLQQMASTFAGIVTAFCNSLNWSMLSLIVGQFKERLFFGVHRDLIDLMRLPDLNYKRARVLFDAGITSLIDLANADVFTVEKVLHNSLSFDTAKQRENEDEYEKNQRNNIRNLYITGKAGLTVKEAAKMLVDDARQFVQYEIGVDKINWNQDGNSKNDESVKMVDLSLKRRLDKDSNVASPPKIQKVIEGEKNGKNKAEKRPANMKRDSDMDNGNRISSTPIEISFKSINLKNTGAKVNDIHLQTSPQNHSIQTISKKVQKNSTEINRRSRENKKSAESLEGKTIPMNSSHASNSKSTTESRTVQIVSTSRNVPAKQTAVDSKSSTIDHQLRSIKTRRSSETSNTGKSKLNNKNGPVEPSAKIAHQKETPRPSKTPEQAKQLTTLDLKTTSAPTSIDKKINGQKEKAQFTPPNPRNHIHYSRNSERTNKEKQTILSKNDKENAPSVRRSPRNHTKKPSTSPLTRRSPSNYRPSSTKIEKLSPPVLTAVENDLFMDDTSFEMNSAITNAMGEAKKDEKPELNKSLNKSSDEIAASQEMTFQPKMQSTRLLRSYRERTENGIKTPPSRTPLRRKSEKDATPANSVPSDPLPNKSSTIEVSDMSLGNSLIQNPIQLNSSHILSTSKTEPDSLSLKSIQIIDMCGSLMLFKSSMKELNQAKVLGLSVGVEKLAGKRKPLIGANLLINQVAAQENSTSAEIDFCIDDTFYISGLSIVMNENVSFFLNLQQEKTGKGVTREMKIESVQNLMKNSEITLQIFDAKEQLKALRKAIADIGEIKCRTEDPKIANWLLQPDKMMSFINMAQQFAPECTALVKLSGSSRSYSSIGLDGNSAVYGKIRSSIEACVTMHITRGQVENLERIGTGQLHKFFIDLEMPLQLSLCEMEIYGFPANETALRDLFKQMMDAMKKLEAKIYEAHGSRFNLGSSSAVAKVVGLHRKSNGRVCTSKQILEMIDHPIAQMIIAYRKLSVTLAKNIQPLLRCIVDDRVHGQSITFTSTGRISMQEPNLQNVAKDFEVSIGNSEKITISCRSSFFPPRGRCLISADFCQLEMRIMAHLSQDPPLLQVMNSEKDVFTAIAARWNKVKEENVSEQLRNGTKQICYGIIYGMGMRSLAESLKCTEQEATTVSEQFHLAYPGIRLYTEKVVKFARQHGYIETITGRRRYLDNINSGEPQLKNQAERQAINSAIQGSAADIAKSAILRMEKNIDRYKQKIGLSEKCVNLVLHLHDELIFEVPEDKARKVAKVLSITMENCVRLSVPLKVKLKIGESWGALREVKL